MSGADGCVVVIAACRSVTETRAGALDVVAGRGRGRGLMRVTRRDALVQHDGKTRERQHQRRRGRHPRPLKHTN